MQPGMHACMQQNVYKYGSEIHKLYSTALKTTQLSNQDTVDHQKKYILANFDAIMEKAKLFTLAKQLPNKDMPGASASRKHKTATETSSDFCTVTNTYSLIIRKNGIKLFYLQLLLKIIKSFMKSLISHQPSYLQEIQLHGHNQRKKQVQEHTTFKALVSL